jgi:RNA polymerase sigma-70 factor (ECF subfamily)
VPIQPSDPTTHLLAGVRRGDDSAAARLLSLVYDELHALAANYFRRQPPDHTLQPTALVHEAYLRLVRQEDRVWESRAHFMAVASKAMRQILVNHARRRAAARRGGNLRRLTLQVELTPAPQQEVELVALDEALKKLALLSERVGRVVELRFFGGLTVDEVAHVLGFSKRTVEGDWRTARAWLARALSAGGDP